MGGITVAFAFGFLRFSVPRRLSSDRDHHGSSAQICSSGPVGHQRCGFRVFTEEVLTYVSAVFGFEGLVVAVNGFVHQLDQFTAGVFTQQLIPTTAHMTLITFQPAPAKMPSSSLTMRVTGDRGRQRRCRLQLIAKTGLSSFFTVGDE